MTQRGVVLAIHLLAEHGKPPVPAEEALALVGHALEVTGSCTPCEVIGRLNAVADPAALRDALQGRRGVLCRVVAVAGRGTIRRGDAVVAVVAEGAQ